jgi:hypothetical protein
VPAEGTNKKHLCLNGHTFIIPLQDCKGAKDAHPQQDELRKREVGEVTQSQAHLFIL